MHDILFDSAMCPARWHSTPTHRLSDSSNVCIKQEESRLNGHSARDSIASCRERFACVIVADISQRRVCKRKINSDKSIMRIDFQLAISSRVRSCEQLTRAVRVRVIESDEDVFVRVHVPRASFVRARAHLMSRVICTRITVQSGRHCGQTERYNVPHKRSVKR